PYPTRRSSDLLGALHAGRPRGHAGAGFPQAGGRPRGGCLDRYGDGASGPDHVPLYPEGRHALRDLCGRHRAERAVPTVLQSLLVAPLGLGAPDRQSWSSTTVTPWPPAWGSARRQPFTLGSDRSSSWMARRKVPVPLPCTIRTVDNPASTA